MKKSLFSPAVAAVVVAALGYLVDVYDLVLFSVVRVPSLRSLGLSEQEVFDQGVYLLNMQMIGMLLGGVLWGVLGDKKGRLSVLFGSILMYSIANIANAFVSSVETYAILRLIAGIGLAGELGAGITLVAELLPKEKRGIGTTIVATVGVAGAVIAAVVGQSFPWRWSYLVGGVLGLSLLLLRISVHESGIFGKTKEAGVRQGDLILLLSSKERMLRYLNCVLVGMTTWYTIGVLVTFIPEIGKAMELPDVPNSGEAIKYAYLGLVVGDLASGLLSQVLKSRKKAIGIFLVSNVAMSCLYLSSGVQSAEALHRLCFPLGFSVGFWAVFITTAAEQFGTNLRATVTTSVPNFVRGSTVLLTSLFATLKPSVGTIESAYLVGAFCITLSFLALHNLKESFHNDLEFIEE